MLNVFFFFQNLQETTEFDQAVSRPNVRLLLQLVAFSSLLAHMLAWRCSTLDSIQYTNILANTFQQWKYQFC